MLRSCGRTLPFLSGTCSRISLPTSIHICPPRHRGQRRDLSDSLWWRPAWPVSWVTTANLNLPFPFRKSHQKGYLKGEDTSPLFAEFPSITLCRMNWGHFGQLSERVSAYT